MNKLNLRKTAALLLSLITAFCLTACGGDTPGGTKAPETSASTQAIVITTAADTTAEPTTEAQTTAEQTTSEATEAPTEAVTTAEETTAPKADPFSEADLVLTVDGVDLSLRIDFVPLAGKIRGGVYDEQVGQACVGGGNDRAYYYDGDAVSVYTVGSASGEQTIYDIYITLLEGYTTQKGAVIGTTTRDEVLAIYGEPYSTFPASERYSVDGKLELIFGFDGEILSSVGLHDNEVQ